jgi:hypothetical protein
MLWNLGPFVLTNFKLLEGVFGKFFTFIGNKLKLFLILVYFGLAAVGLLILGTFSIYKCS